MTHRGHDFERLRAIAAHRGGVVSPTDLSECGFGYAAIRRRLDDGTWRKVGGAIVLAPGLSSRPQVSDLGLAWTLRLTFGPRTQISGVLALRRAAWTLPVDSHIVVLPDKTHARLSGVTVLRRFDARVELPDDGLTYVPPLVALLDILSVVPARQATDLLDAALQRRYVRPDTLARDIEGRLGRGRRGAAQLRTLLHRASTGSRSEAEQRMALLLRRSGTGAWVPNRAIHADDGSVLAEIDFAHEELRIAIEVDGRAFHSDRRSFERDRSRQNQLSIGGWLILRFTWEQITEHPQEVIAAIRAAVRVRSEELGRSA